MKRWQAATLVFGGFATLSSIGALLAPPWAGATTVDVTQGAKCVSAPDHRYDVSVSAHNTYTTVLHVRVNNPASPIDLALNPDQKWAYTFHVIDGPWKVTFTSTDAHLSGDTSHTWTLTDVCGVPVTTTTPPTTTCSQAIPPRNDCGTATTPAPAPTTTVPVDSTAPSVPVPPSSVPPVTTPPSVTGGIAHPTTIAQRIELPVTGLEVWMWVLVALGGILLGALLVWLTTYRNEDEL